MAKRARYILRSALLDSRALGAGYVGRRGGYESRRVAADTAVVIEGFPRSANSYARWAFEQASGGEFPLAGHTHSSAIARLGVRRGIPTIVIVRDPDDAVASLLQMDIGATAGSGFHAYDRFYRRLLSYRSGIHVARFEDVVGDFGAVLRQASAYAGTVLPVFDPTPDNARAVSDRLDAANRERNEGTLDEASVSRPSARRRTSSEVLKGLGPAATWQRRRARRTYNRFVAGH